MSLSFVLEPTSEEIILYFKIESDGIDALTFGNALISFDQIYRSINEVINPGLDVEIEFIRSDQGSIRAVLKSIKKDSGTLVKSPLLLVVFPFLLGVLVNVVTSDNVKIVVNDDSYVVEHGRERVVLPRAAKDKADQVQRDPAVRQAIRNFFTVVESDPNVRSVDFRPAKTPDVPALPIDRDKFVVLREIPDVVRPDLPRQRQHPYPRQMVVVVTAVLERARRRWQFIWNGLRISADIQDDDFFDRLANHEYEFGQGDMLVVDLVAEQELNDIVGAYETKRYHVTKVHSHKSGPKQDSFNFR